MALTRAQLLQGNSANGIVLSGQPTGVIAGSGITIDSAGIISVNASTVIGLVKLNNPSAYNAYVWPGVDGATGTFLKTDGAGNLSWATVQGAAVVTVSTITPAPADIGELWFDCNTGTLNVFQNCVAPGGWTNVAQPGLPVLPTNTSAAPAFTGGNGTQATPYDCTITTTGAGTTVFVINTVTITNLAPFQYVPIIDLNAVTNGGRFTFSNFYADAGGSLTFQTIFDDSPSSTPGTTYNAAIKVGYGTVYIDAIVNVVTALSVTAGAISGTPQVGSVLTYAQGVASGGTAPYAYTQVWKRDGVVIAGATGLTYTLVSADLGKSITVEITATDANLTVATATTAPVGPVVTAPFPTATWNPGPAGGLNNIPGLISGPYTGTGPISSTGCIEFSVNGGAYGQGPTAITSGQTLATRWVVSPACGGAASGTNLTGSISDGVYENSYAVTVNRVPNPALANVTDTNIALSAVATKALAAAVAGLTATSYITLGAGSTGTSIQVSTDGVTFTTVPSAPSTLIPVTNGQTITIRQTVGGATSIGYIAAIIIGDSTGSGGAVGTFQTVTYTATTVSTAIFPNSPFTPVGGPNASPAATSEPAPFMPTAIEGTATATWGDGAVTLTGTNLVLNVGGGAFAGSQAVVNTNVVGTSWLPSYITGLANGATATGSFTDGAFTNSYTFTVDKQPAWTVPAPVTGAALSTQQTTGVLTPNNFNCPVTVSFAAPGGTDLPMTSVGVSINGGATTPITLGTTTVTLNPGDTFEVFGTTGAANSQVYGVAVTLGAAAAQTWQVTTTAVVASITTPSITAPVNGATGLNPATNSPAGIPLTGSNYLPLNGAGAVQTSSTWEVYKGGFPLGPSTNTITTVTAGTAGTPGTIKWKTSSSADTNPPSQNEVYGKLATDFFTGTTYPAFNWAKGLTIGGHTDWYIPAKNELEILYFNLKPTTAANTNSGGSGINPNAVPARASAYPTSGPPAVNPAQTTNALFQSGGSEAFSTGSTYWSSTQDSSFTNGAWRQFFTDGIQVTSGTSKSASMYARAIRRITIADYTAAGSPAIGASLAGGFYAGQISTAGNSVADYALIVAPNSSGTFGYTGGSNASLTIAGANTDGFVAGLTIKGNTSNATGVILSVNGTTITYLPSSGTFATGETISTLPASYTQITGSPITVSAAPFTTANVPQASLAVSSTYYARVQYATTNATAATSLFGGWSSFATASVFLPAPGGAFGGGYFGGQIKVFAGQDGGGLPAVDTIYNLIVAPVVTGQFGGSTPTTIQYKTSGSADAPTATVQNQVYGGRTTDLFKASAAHPVFGTFINGASGPNAGAFNLATGGAGGGTGIGGFNDWYLPAKNELEILYFNLKPSTSDNNNISGINPNAVPARTNNYTGGSPATNPAQTTSALFKSGGSEAFSSAVGYWSSTEASVQDTAAVYQNFNIGQQSENFKNNSYYARAIRRIAA